MSDRTCTMEINLDVLRAAAPFILAVDGNLRVTWASPACLRRFAGAVGRDASEIASFDEPREALTLQTVRAAAGRLRRLVLLDGDPPTPLAGQWIRAGHAADAPARTGQPEEGEDGGGEGFVLLAVPHVAARDVLDLSLFQFDDFPADGAMVDLLVLRDLYGTAQKSAERSVRELQRRMQHAETARHRSERNSVRLQRETFEPRRVETAIPMTQDFQFQVKLHSIAATAVMTLDENGNFTSVNDAFCAITGYSEHDVLGRSRELLAEEPCAIYDAGGHEAVARAQCRIRTKDGRSLTVLKSSGTVCDSQGRISGSVEAFVDVTGLVRAIGEAENAGRARMGLVVNRSRTVGDSVLRIKDVLELLSHSDLRAEQRELLAAALFAAETAADLNGDILNFAGIDAGRLEIETAEFNLRAALKDALRRPFALAAEKNLALECHVSPYVPDSLAGDPGQLRRILANLVRNAVACTDRGEVAVHVATESQLEGEICLHISVADSGAGMTHEKQALLRELLAGEAPLTAEESCPVGLGLVVASRLAESMGGALWFESEPGRGSTFHFNLRFQLGEMNAEEAPPPQAMLDIAGDHRAFAAPDQSGPRNAGRGGGPAAPATAPARREYERAAVSVRPVAMTQEMSAAAPRTSTPSQAAQSELAPERPAGTAVVEMNVTRIGAQAAAGRRASAAAVAQEAAAKTAEAQQAAAQQAAAQQAAAQQAAAQQAAAQQAAEREAAAREAAAREAAKQAAAKQAAAQQAAEREAAAREAAATAAAREAAAKESAAKAAAAREAAAKEAAAKGATASDKAPAHAASSATAPNAKQPNGASGAAGTPQAVQEAELEDAADDDDGEVEAGEPSAFARQQPPSAGSTSAAAVAGDEVVAEEEIDEDPLVGMSVLVVDDDRKNRLGLKKMLMSWRMKPTVVNGGRAALAALWQAHETARPYALILLDAEMPEMDGFMIAEKIKRNPEIQGARIIMLTSNDELVDAGTCREMGISGCLWMPVKPKTLLEKIRAVTKDAPAPGTVADGEKGGASEQADHES